MVRVDGAARGRERLRFSRPGRPDELERFSPLAEGIDVDVAAVAALTVVDPPPAPTTPRKGATAIRVPGPCTRMPPRPRSPEEAARTLREALARAVDASVGEARRIAVLGGGGLDSAVILGLAAERARARGHEVLAVAVDFGGEGDDRPYFRALVDQLGVEVVRVTPEDAGRELATWLGGVDGVPLTWPTAPLEIVAMARAREHGAERVLTGIGGDELFDGAPHVLSGVARARPLEAMRRARALQGFDEPWSRLVEWVLRPTVAAWVPRTLRVARARRHPLEAPPWAGPALLAYLRGVRDEELERLRLTGRTSLPRGGERHLGRIAWLRHQEEVAAEVTRHDPLLDRGLVAWVDAIPPAWLLEGDRRRGLFREAATGLVPDALRDRSTKAYFEEAFVRMLAAAGGIALVEPYADAALLASLGVVQPGPFGEAFRAFARDVTVGPAWTSVWPVLMIEAWLRRSPPSIAEEKLS